MPNVSQANLDEIKTAAIPVHQSLYALEAQFKAIRGRIPECFRPAVDECVRCHHSALQTLRETILESLPITPLDDDELVALGGPGGGGK